MVNPTRIDKLTGKSQHRNKEFYSDFLANFNKHPETDFLVKNINAAAVKRAIRNLLLTMKGERPFQPNYGSGLRALLFEPMVDSTTELIKGLITEAIEQNEPRVRLLEVVVVPNEISQVYNIGIAFEIINNPEPEEVTIELERVR